MKFSSWRTPPRQPLHLHWGEVTSLSPSPIETMSNTRTWNCICIQTGPWNWKCPPRTLSHPKLLSFSNIVLNFFSPSFLLLVLLHRKPRVVTIDDRFCRYISLSISFIVIITPNQFYPTITLPMSPTLSFSHGSPSPDSKKSLPQIQLCLLSLPLFSFLSSLSLVFLPSSYLSSLIPITLVFQSLDKMQTPCTLISHSNLSLASCSPFPSFT